MPSRAASSQGDSALGRRWEEGGATTLLTLGWLLVLAGLRANNHHND